ncbi:MAG: FtsW/RodA/SpoVE family cell cycle protein [Ignavibacteriae bacterium]|nr:FtsW/RodA/SpoVE family cell cycle protein [Ignavibacteriota bacterium]
MKNLTRILIGIVLGLIILGSGIIFSAKGMSYFVSHIEKVLLSVGVFVLFAIVPYKYYRDYSKYMLIAIVGILLATLLFAPAVNGASRWIDIGIMKFQPSEFAKIFLLIHLASMIESKGKKIKDFNEGLLYMLIWIGIVCSLIFFQPNVSTTLIIASTSFVLLFVGGARLLHLGSIVGALFLMVGSGMMMFSHSRTRVLTYLSSFMDGTMINFQVLQSKIALGSGGFFGLGMGRSKQTNLFLPEAHNDFIFSVLGEEFGFIGAVTILFAYLALFLVGLLIAKKAKDDFGQLLAFSISFTIIISAFIHVAVGLGVIPTTGITLPFMSFGGTSIIIFSISIGILVNIARLAEKHKEIRSSRSRARI